MMIDLSKKLLPNAILIDDEYYPIKTDYRTWLMFWREIKELTASGNLSFDFVFTSNVPCDRQKAFDGCMNFYLNADPLPRPTGANSHVIPYDYDMDSDYIYAAFMQQYGIDLLAADMHWHVFKALFGGITEPCKLASIIAARCYDGTDKERIKLKQTWEIVSMRQKDSHSSELEKLLMNGGDISSLIG